MRKTLMEIYDDNWRNENVSFIEALVDVIKEIESRLSALERQPRLPMTDFDALIDNFEKSRDAMYETVTAQEREEVKERHKQSRTALRGVITQLEQELDNLKTVLHGNQDADYDKQLQIETLKAQLAEAEADADRLASRWVVLGQNCCSFCGKPVKWSMRIDAECPIADHAPDCPILHHQKRKEGK